MIKYYMVGGAVRDKILGIDPKYIKDIDYSVEAPSYEAMKTELLKRGLEMFPIKEDYMTIRGKLNGVAADFVLCRKDGHYSDGRRPDTVEIGTLYDDLARRDFTMNAIAIDSETGEYIDLFNGREDIANKLIRCVGSADRLREDSLRMIRALRFKVTKGFYLHEDVVDCIESDFKLLRNVSRERIYEEMNRMFAVSSIETFKLMIDFEEVFRFIFEECKVDLAAVLKEVK